VRVAWAIPCRYAEVQPGGGATIVGAGSDVLIVEGVPAQLHVLFAVRFVGAPDELDGELSHPVGCGIYSPDGELAGEQTSMLQGDINQLVPGFVAEVTVAMATDIEATELGSYGVEFAIDGNALRVPIHVVEADPAS